MEILIQLVLLILGFFVLIRGADYLIDGASSIAINLNVPEILVGLTVVAFGTSAPETAVSIKSLLNNNGDMVIGNVIGSNILNILLIIGISACIFPLKVNDDTIQKEIPFTFLVSLLLFVLLGDTIFGNGTVNMISRGDGIVILIFFLVFLYYLIMLARSGNSEEIESKYSIKEAVLYTILGLVCIVLGGDFVVESASTIAAILGVGQKFISLTIVAFGTSLPELVTCITAAKKQAQDIAIGNIIGSNIFNICFVIGLPTAILGNIVPTEAVYVDLVVMLMATILLFIFSKSEREVSKKEGSVFLIMFAVYYTYLIVSQLNIVVG